MERETSGHRVLLTLGSGGRGAFRTDGRVLNSEEIFFSFFFLFLLLLSSLLGDARGGGSAFLMLVERMAGFSFLVFRVSLEHCLA